MRIGCGRLVAVLWTLLMKDTSRLGKHHEGRLFLRQTSSAPLQKLGNRIKIVLSFVPLNLTLTFNGNSTLLLFRP